MSDVVEWESTNDRKRASPKSTSAAQEKYTQGGLLALSFIGQDESGWCSDMTSTHGAWRRAGVRFLLLGDLLFCLP